MATPSDPENKKMKKQYCLKLDSRMHKNAYFRCNFANSSQGHAPDTSHKVDL